MVYVQNFSFFVTASLTYTTPLFNKTQFEHSLCLHFILTRTTDLIQIANPTFVRARPAAGFFICARKNQCPAYSTRNFFPAILPVTFQATEYPSFTKLNRPTVHRNTTDRACCIGISFILLSNSSSVPQRLAMPHYTQKIKIWQKRLQISTFWWHLNRTAKSICSQP